MTSKLLQVCEPFLGAKELTYVTEALQSGALSGSFGRFIGDFERAFAAYFEAKHGISVTSGSTALHLAVSCLGIGPGDEVLVPAFTNIASAYCVVYVGAKPVFIDSEPDTWNMNLELLEASITPQTKAIVAVHIYGHPLDMDRLVSIAKKHNLLIIEDVAEAHGAECRGRKVGNYGQMNCFSFYANKIITTGEGGMILTDDDQLAEQAKLRRNLAFSPKKRFLHEVLGYNYRMSNLHAAVGLAQTEQLTVAIDRKRWMAGQYNERLRAVPGLRLPIEKPWAKNVYWMYGIVVDADFGMTRNEFSAALRAENIETRDFFYPLNRQPVFKDLGLLEGQKACPVAEDLGERGLYLPSGIGLLEADIDRVCATIIRIQKNATPKRASMSTPR